MPTTPASPLAAQRRPGLIFGLLELSLRLLGLLFASLIFSIVLEFVGMLWFWPEQGWHHSHAFLIVWRCKPRSRSLGGLKSLALRLKSSTTNQVIWGSCVKCLTKATH